MSPTDIEKFRIETLSHPDTHLYSATIYYPIHSLNPIAQTACIYKTKQEAHSAVQELIKAFP